MAEFPSRCSRCGKVRMFGELSSLPEVVEYARYLAGVAKAPVQRPDDTALLAKYGYTQEDCFCTGCYGVVTSV